jgi:hypothetical protein
MVAPGPRSPILQVLPERLAGLGRARVVSRYGGVITAGTVIAVLVLGTTQRRFPATQGWGYAIYAIHDTFFLRLKGYTYTAEFPYSLIWWGSVVGVSLAILVALLAGRSFVRRPHVQLTRQLIGHAHLHGILIGTVRVLNRFGLGSELIRDVALCEGMMAVRRVADQPTVTPGEIRAAERRTQLAVQIATLRRVPRLDILVAHRLWLDAFLALRFAQPAAADRLLLRVERQVGAALQQEAEQSSESAFDWPRLAADLLILLRSEDTTSLASSTDLRRALLDRARSYLELRYLRKSAYAEQMRELPIALAPDQLAVQAHIAEGIAAILCAVSEDPHRTLAYLEAVNGLSFMLDMAETFARASQDDLLPRLHALTSDLPRVEHLRLTGRRAAALVDERRADWINALSSGNTVVQQADFDVLQLRADTLALAAGPGVSAERSDL